MNNLSELSREQLLQSLSEISRYLQVKELLNKKIKEASKYKQDLLDNIDKVRVRNFCIDSLIEDKMKNGNTDANGKDISIFNLKVLKNEYKIDSTIFYGSIVISVIVYMSLKTRIYFLLAGIICVALWYALYYMIQNYTVIQSHLTANDFVNEQVNESCSVIINNYLTKGKAAEKWQQLNSEKEDVVKALTATESKLKSSGSLALMDEFNLDDINIAIHAITIGRANNWRDCTDIIHQHRIEEENRQDLQKQMEEEHRHHIKMEGLEQQRISNELSHQTRVEDQNGKLIKKVTKKLRR